MKRISFLILFLGLLTLGKAQTPTTPGIPLNTFLTYFTNNPPDWRMSISTLADTSGINFHWDGMKTHVVDIDTDYEWTGSFWQVCESERPGGIFDLENDGTSTPVDMDVSVLDSLTFSVPLIDGSTPRTTEIRIIGGSPVNGNVPTPESVGLNFGAGLRIRQADEDQWTTLGIDDEGNGLFTSTGTHKFISSGFDVSANSISLKSYSGSLLNTFNLSSTFTGDVSQTVTGLADQFPASSLADEDPTMGIVMTDSDGTTTFVGQTGAVGLGLYSEGGVFVGSIDGVAIEGNYFPGGTPTEGGLGSSGPFVMAFGGDGSVAGTSNSGFIDIADLGGGGATGGNAIFVSESTAAVNPNGSRARPYNNPWQAVGAAQVGDVVYVIDGTWTYGTGAVDQVQSDTAIIVKSGVTVFFSDGTTIDVSNHVNQDPISGTPFQGLFDTPSGGGNTISDYHLTGSLRLLSTVAGKELGFPRELNNSSMAFDNISVNCEFVGASTAEQIYQGDEVIAGRNFKLYCGGGSATFTGYNNGSFIRLPISIDDAVFDVPRGSLILNSVGLTLDNTLEESNIRNFSMNTDSDLFLQGQVTLKLQTLNMDTTSYVGSSLGGSEIRFEGFGGSSGSINIFQGANLKMNFKGGNLTANSEELTPFYNFAFLGAPEKFVLNFEDTNTSRSGSLLGMDFFPAGYRGLNLSDTTAYAPNSIILTGDLDQIVSDTVNKFSRLLVINNTGDNFNWSTQMNDWITLKSFNFFTNVLTNGSAATSGLFHLNTDGSLEVRTINFTTPTTTSTVEVGKTASLLYKGILPLNPY